MRMTPKHTDARYIEFLNKFLKSFDKCVYGPDTLTAYGAGWQDCQEIILGMLKNPLQNADLSEDNCDERYIKQIEKL